MSTFVFTGDIVQPKIPSYRLVELTERENNFALDPESITLEWNDAARLMDLNGIFEAPGVPQFNLTLPPANEVSVGQDILFYNIGASKSGGGGGQSRWDIKDNSGNSIYPLLISPGTALYIYLLDNSDVAGTWRTLIYGTGSSGRDSEELTFGSRKGTARIGNFISKELITTENGSPSFPPLDRAGTSLWGFGAVSVTLAAASSNGNGFFAYVSNLGTGNISFARTGADTLNGGTANVAVSPNESVAWVSDGISKWYTLFGGRSATYAFWSREIDIPADETTILVPRQSSGQILTFTGGHGTIVFPKIASPYFINNQSTGSNIEGTNIDLDVRTIFWSDGYQALPEVLNTGISISSSVTLTQGTNGETTRSRIATTLLTGVAGASVTATNLIPDGAVVLGVSTYVVTALGVTGGTTGYQVGDGVDPDRWGNITGTAIGTDSDNTDATSGSVSLFIAANNVVITANGGNFDGTGDIRVTVHYMDITAPTS